MFLFGYKIILLSRQILSQVFGQKYMILKLQYSHVFKIFLFTPFVVLSIPQATWQDSGKLTPRIRLV